MELVSLRAAIAPGERFAIALRQRIVPGWHTYWRNSGDSGAPVFIGTTALGVLKGGATAGGARAAAMDQRPRRPSNTSAKPLRA